MQEEENGPEEERVVDMDPEAGKEENDDKEETGGSASLMTLEAYSASKRSESKSGTDSEETRKEQVNWKELKLESEVRDLLSRTVRKMRARRRQESRKSSEKREQGCGG
jgi:hypothetical protein